MQYDGDKYTIWKQDGNKKPTIAKMNLDISQATSFITYQRQSLSNGERFFTENQESSKVDMFFTSESVITPDMPMYVYDGKLSKASPKFRNTSKTMKMLDKENKKGNLKIGKKSKPTSNMTDVEFWQWTRRGETLTKTEQKRFERLRTNNKFRNQVSKPKMMKPKKSRGKWVGNMFRASNKKLTQVSKTGTPKQKKLAKSIIARRRKN